MTSQSYVAAGVSIGLSACLVIRDVMSAGIGTAGPAAASSTAGTLQSMTDATCLHTSPHCALPQRQWAVQVDVVG